MFIDAQKAQSRFILNKSKGQKNANHAARCNSWSEWQNCRNAELQRISGKRSAYRNVPHLKPWLCIQSMKILYLNILFSFLVAWFIPSISIQRQEQGRELGKLLIWPLKGLLTFFSGVEYDNYMKHLCFEIIQIIILRIIMMITKNIQMIMITITIMMTIVTMTIKIIRIMIKWKYYC